MDALRYGKLVDCCTSYIESRAQYLEVSAQLAEAQLDYAAATAKLLLIGEEMAKDCPPGISVNTFFPISEQENAMRDAATASGLDYDTDDQFDLFRRLFGKFREQERREAAKYN